MNYLTYLLWTEADMVDKFGIQLELVDDLRTLDGGQRPFGGLDQQASHFSARRTVGTHGRVPGDLVLTL